jgi:hypothetical protein
MWLALKNAYSRYRLSTWTKFRWEKRNFGSIYVTYRNNTTSFLDIRKLEISLSYICYQQSEYWHISWFFYHFLSFSQKIDFTSLGGIPVGRFRNLGQKKTGAQPVTPHCSMKNEHRIRIAPKYSGHL